MYSCTIVQLYMEKLMHFVRWTLLQDSIGCHGNWQKLHFRCNCGQFFALWDFSVSTMRFFCNILRLSRRHGMFFATPETSTELHISFDPAMLWIPPTDGSESKCLLWLWTLLIFGLFSSNQRSVSLSFCIFYISDNKEMPWGQIFDPFQDIKCDSTAYL